MRVERIWEFRLKVSENSSGNQVCVSENASRKNLRIQVEGFWELKSRESSFRFDWSEMHARSARSNSLCSQSVPAVEIQLHKRSTSFIAHSLIAGILLWQKTWAFAHICEDYISKIAAKPWVTNSLGNLSNYDEESHKIVTNLQLTMKNSSFAHFAREFFARCVNILALSATWNGLFSSCVDDVGIWWQMFNF